MSGVPSALLAFNKPFGVLCQFSPSAGKRTLADFVHIASVYPAGRLDADSEGLLLLTDDGALQHHLTDPCHKLWKTYLTQVEGAADEKAIARLQEGLILNDGPTLPSKARIVDQPDWLWPRDPPIRYRAAIPTSWIELQLREGRNRQVRRMTAAVGFPTLRLIRTAIGAYTLDGLAPGKWRELELPSRGSADRTPRSHRRRSTAKRPV